MFCKNCGKEISDKAVVCVECGCSVVETKKAKPKKKKVIVVLCIILFLIIVGIASGGSDNSTTSEENNSYTSTADKTTVPAEFSEECPINVSAYVEENIIGVPELVCNIKNQTEKEIAAVQFYFAPIDVYGEQVNTVMTSNRLYTDERIDGNKSVTRSWQLLDNNIKAGTVYVYSVYFADGTEWGNKDASTGTIEKYCEKIIVSE